MTNWGKKTCGMTRQFYYDLNQFNDIKSPQVAFNKQKHI